MTRVLFAVFYAAMIVAWTWMLRFQEREYLRWWWYRKRRLIWWRIWAYVNIAWCSIWLVTIPFR